MPRQPSSSRNDRKRVESAGRLKPAQVLVRLAARAQLICSADGRCYARVPVNERHEIYELRSAGFRDWLTAGYLREQPEPPADWAIHRVIGSLEAQARFASRTPEVFIRVGRQGEGDEAGDGFGPGRPQGEVDVIDLGDSSGRAVEVCASGWSVVDRPNVLFRRPDGLLPLPMPSRDGSIELLRPYVNLSEVDLILVIAWLTAALRPVGPYPILVITGGHGAAKSTLARILRSLIDPHSGPLLIEPRSARDLMVTAADGWLLAYDNLTAIPGWLSDCLCQLVYGASFASRALFTNHERTVIHSQRPVILCGLDDFVRRGDLRDRCVFLELPPVSPLKRRAEAEFWKAFHADRPRIFAGVLDAIAGGVRALPSIQLHALPRMADHARWGEAVGRGLGWKTEHFLAAYDRNIRDASMALLEESMVGIALLGMTPLFHQGWRGSPSELYSLLTQAVDRRHAACAGWPKSLHTFGHELRRLLPQLRMHGLTIEFQRRDGRRFIVLSADPLHQRSQFCGS
jgi:hypothetical protein